MFLTGRVVTSLPHLALFVLCLLLRRIYHQYRVLDHYLPLGSQEGGCDGSARKACSVIFGVLLSR